MGGLVKNELIKLYYRKKILIASVILIFISVCIFVSVNFFSGEKKLKNISNQIEVLKNKESKATSPREKEKLSLNINQLQIMVMDYEDEVNKPSDYWKEKAKSKISQLKQFYDSDEIDIDPIRKENTYNDILLYQYALENDIKPSSSFTLSQCDFMVFYINVIGSIFIFIIICIIASDIISSEFSPSTIKMMMLKPIRPFTIVLSKFFAAFISSFAIIFGIELLSFILSGFAFGFTSMKYPIIIHPNFGKSEIFNPVFEKYISLIPNTSYIMPAYKFFILCILLQVIFIAVVTAFCIFISSLFKSNGTAISISTILGIASFVLLKTNKLSAIAPYLFTSYGDVASIVNKDFILSTGAYKATFSFAIVILFMWLFFSLVLSYIAFNKKDLIK